MQIVAETLRLKQRIQELEEKVERLRFSRRVLMNLLERLEHEHRDGLLRLEKQNLKLKNNNYRYATDLLYKNKRIIELEK